ncbi:MAG TPA: hypothetical protein VGP63_23200 [Planctomycetaceae bacterium]|jgi:hypothetical protein|nr:hypothetical protein [Planctomycetaceae bacterium]
MLAVMNMGDITGESTGKDHKDWFLLESVSAPIHRSIAERDLLQGG